MQTVQLTEAPQTPKPSNTGFAFTGLQKGVLLVLILGLLYLRLIRRRRKLDNICSRCGTHNPHHLANCHDCSAPLFRN